MFATVNITHRHSYHRRLLTCQHIRLMRKTLPCYDQNIPSNSQVIPETSEILMTSLKILSRQSDVLGWCQSLDRVSLSHFTPIKLGDQLIY